MRTSPLHHHHVAHGAQMKEVDGWAIPHAFRSLLEEHKAARSACAVFDISYLAKFHLRGNGTVGWLEHVLHRPLADVRDGTCVSAELWNETDGCSTASVTLLRESAGSFFMIAPPGSEHTIFEYLQTQRLNGAIEVRNETSERCGMALIGPQSEEVLQRVLHRETELPLKMRFTQFYLQGQQLMLGRLGLHQEREEEKAYEFFCPAVEGIRWYEELIASGAQPCGLATRECLRLERDCAEFDHCPAQ